MNLYKNIKDIWRNHFRLIEKINNIMYIIHKDLTLKKGFHTFISDFPINPHLPLEQTQHFQAGHP